MTVADYREVNELRAVDAAYIAGLIDGEGTVSLLRKHKQDNRQLVVSVCNTERPMLDYLLAAIGAGKITGKRTYAAQHAPSYTYAITNRHALDLLRQVSPYLRTYKAQRAAMLLSDYVRLTPRNGKYTVAGAAEREAFVQAFFAIEPGSATPPSTADRAHGPFGPRGQDALATDTGAAPMSAVQFSVPDEVSDAFNSTHADQDKSAIVAELTRDAVARAQRKQPRHEAIQRILDRRSDAPRLSDAEIAALRHAGRP
jgi:hypothetical protein